VSTTGVFFDPRWRRLQHGLEHERCGSLPLGGGSALGAARVCAVLCTYTGYESSYPSCHEALSLEQISDVDSNLD
jgi:hypothetical protein